MLAMHDELQKFAKTIVSACGNAMQRPHMKSMDDLDMIEGKVLVKSSPTRLSTSVQGKLPC